MPSRRPRATFEDLVRVREDVRAVDDRLVHAIPLESIQPSPRNPRQRLDGIDDLAASLDTHGLLQPIVVRRCGAGYQLIAGHRRYAAAQQLAWTEIAAVVRDETDDQAYILTLVENLQREDLSPKEEASALEVLVRERGWTTRQVGEAIKRNHTYVSRRLRVFDDPVLAPLVLEQKLAVSTAEELLRAPDAVARQDLAVRAADSEWTWAEARRAISEIGAGRTKVTSLLVQLRRMVSDVGQIEPESLTAAERKQIRQARAALGRLLLGHG